MKMYFLRLPENPVRYLGKNSEGQFFATADLRIIHFFDSYREAHEVSRKLYSQWEICQGGLQLKYGTVKEDSTVTGNITLTVSEGNLHAKKYEILLQAVLDELVSAQRKFPPFHSSHEGYAIILEEVEELWEAIRRNKPSEATQEATQVAAMGLRYCIDLSGAFK